MSRSKAKKYIVLVLLTVVTSVVYAQPGPPPDPEVGGGGDNPVPITGIEYLIAAGAAFGAKKLYNKKKAN